MSLHHPLSSTQLPATAALFETNPFIWSESNRALFWQSFREMATHHYNQSAIFRAFWEDAGVRPADIKSDDDVARIPAIMVHLFKEFDFCSVPRQELVLTLTSSGTGGQKSKQYLNQFSLDAVSRLAYQVHHYLGMTSKTAVNYLCFTYDPAVAKDLGTAFTDQLLTGLTKIKRVVYAICWDEQVQDFVFNEQFVIETIRQFQDEYKKDGTPMRILGFPAFLYKVLQSYPNEQFEFGPDSWVQTGGGWKNHADQEIPKSQFRHFVATRLGIPEANLRDLFGMVEHGVPYVDCAKGFLHIPNYARILIRDPHSLAPLPNGQTGLIQFICSYNQSYPCLSVLSTDYGVVTNCECALGGPILQIKGRAGVTKHKGCALKANELLQKN